MRCPSGSFSLAALLGLAMAGCGPSVSESRLISASPRASDCELEFVEYKMEDVAPGGKWEVLGYVMLGEQGVQDPLQPEYRAAVRPRACAMGGEAVGIAMTGTATPWALSAGGTSIAYAVLRKPPAPDSKPKEPQKF